MIRYRWYHSGDVFGIRYEMPKGDYLPLHVHVRAELHNVIVLTGSAKFTEVDGYGPPLEITLRAGEVFDFDGGTPHRIESLEDGTVLLNLFLHGIPVEYKTLPASEHAGTFDPRGRR